MIIPLNDEDCIPDNFAGGGGATEGVQNGLQRNVTDAINHDAIAIAMHQANHPESRHWHTNIWTTDPLRVTDYRRVPFAWFSPDCRHFSRAKGGKPVDRKVRGLANIVHRWADLTDMKVFALENVCEFQEWGPVDRETNLPIDSRKGEIFRRWWGKLEDRGYDLQMRIFRMCDYGVPTSRTRLVIVGRKDGLPIVWPEATHGEGLLPYRTAAECIDFSIPCPSIFQPGRNLVDNTLRRVARGLVRYIIKNPRPFIVPLTHHGSADRVYDIHDPFRTITGANRGEFGLATPKLIPLGHSEQVVVFLARHYGGHENDGAPLTGPMPTITSQDHHALITAHIQRDFGQSVGHAADQPLGSITADGGGHAALVSSNLVKLKGTCRDGQPVDVPIHTIQANGTHYAEVRAFLIKYYGTDQDPRLELPLGTITTKDRFAVVYIYGHPYAIVDIGMRMLTPRELFRAHGFREDYVIDPLVQDKRVKKREKLIPLPKTGQIKMVGNSVPPTMPELVVSGNMAPYLLAA